MPWRGPFYTQILHIPKIYFVKVIARTTGVFLRIQNLHKCTDDVPLPTVTLYYTQSLCITHSHSILHRITLYYTQSLYITHSHSVLHTVTLYYTQSLYITHSHSVLHTVTLYYTQSLYITHSHSELHTVTLYYTQSLCITHSHSILHTVTLYYTQSLYITHSHSILHTVMHGNISINISKFNIFEELDFVYRHKHSVSLKLTCTLKNSSYLL